MHHLDIEFKATADNLAVLEQKLQSLNPVFKGIDEQIDTYYNVQIGRLKLREGNIENALIWYDRPNVAAVKQSDILLYTHEPAASLKLILEKVHGVKVVVVKKRKIYFVENVKIHFDEVRELGTFLEVEAISQNGNIAKEKLIDQSKFFIDFFEVKPEDFIANSYSDLLLEKINLPQK